MNKIIAILLAATFAATLATSATAASGEKAFRKCQACHSLKEGKNKVGPSLYGLAGRPAGTVPGYRYSKALKASGIVWNFDTLGKWLTNPKKMVPRTKMRTKVKKIQDRQAIIEFLLTE